MVKYNDNGNLAHELEMPYEETAQERNEKENETVRAEEEKKAKKKSAPAMSIPAKVAWGVLLIVAVTLMGSLIYGRVEISRLYNERAKLDTELTRLQNENLSMQSEIAERMNMTKVEQYAQSELGLQKLDRSQIEYIEVETPSVAEVKADGGEDAFARVKRWFNLLAEYLGL